MKDIVDVDKENTNKLVTSIVEKRIEKGYNDDENNSARKHMEIFEKYVDPQGINVKC